MYPRNTFFFRLLAALLLVGLLAAAGVTVYRAGFSQGYLQGTAITQGESPGPGPGYPYYPGYWRPHFGFFPFFPLFGLFFFGLLFFWFFGWLFRPKRWGYPGRWHDHPHETPPWVRERQAGERGPQGGEPPEEQERS